MCIDAPWAREAAALDVARSPTGNGALVKLGATRAELEETLGVCLYMGGGPALVYAARALRAFEEFTLAAASRGTAA